MKVLTSAPTQTIVATAIDRNDPLNTTTEITCKGSSDTFEEEASGTTLTTTFDGIYCVGSANPSNNIVNGNAVTFDYNIKKYSSTDSGATYSLDSTTTATYTGNVLYAGADTMYFNPAISATHTSGGSNSIKITIDAEDNLITAQSTGDSLPPAGEILDRYYVFTYVYENGEEGPPSEISNLATIYKGDTASLTNIGDASPPTGVTLKRIYTTSGGILKILGEIDAVETTFTDNVATTALYGEILVANNPPAMHGMVISPLGFTVGWKNRDIFLANEYLPYAWDDQYSITLKYNIVGMIAVNDIVYVLTEGQLYILYGFTISSMTLEELHEPPSCISRSGIPRYTNCAFYISPDGIVMLSGGNSNLFTRDMFDSKIWSTLSADEGALNVHDDTLHMTTPTHHYKFSLAETPILTQGNITSNVVYESLRDDALYYKDDTTIYKYGGGTGTVSATWKSPEYDMRTDTVMSVGRVTADSYNDVTFNVYADGNLVSTSTVLNNKPFRLSGTGRASTWSMEVVTTDTISIMQIASSMKELA